MKYSHIFTSTVYMLSTIPEGDTVETTKSNNKCFQRKINTYHLISQTSYIGYMDDCLVISKTEEYNKHFQINSIVFIY